jgi:hypothetical protein
MGAGATAVSTAETVDAVKTSADVVSVGTTNKTLTDHAIGVVLHRDCRLFNVFDKDKKVCSELPPKMPDFSTIEKVRQFQIAKGIVPANGRIGPKTREAVWRIEHGLDTYEPK